MMSSLSISNKIIINQNDIRIVHYHASFLFCLLARIGSPNRFWRAKKFDIKNVCEKFKFYHFPGIFKIWVFLFQAVGSYDKGSLYALF
ncbi:unnamed protein product [Blepharisma stoltei]|uniref:Uncharacterized protein n=1 Tax=Blepharisma stoltei TaxID=1481888 RepID=A0AAU9J628_9CILI|nr:unnamed protein product [Blepharisma stoltei]